MSSLSNKYCAKEVVVHSTVGNYTFKLLSKSHLYLKRTFTIVVTFKNGNAEITHHGTKMRRHKSVP